MSATYTAAYEADNAAGAAYRLAAEAYRARKIGDAEFLAAARARQEASEKFDAAFAEEAAREESAAA